MKVEMEIDKFNNLCEQLWKTEKELHKYMKALDIASSEHSQALSHNTKDKDLYKREWIAMANEIIEREKE